jgi:CheY-like chemotaxis protein
VSENLYSITSSAWERSDGGTVSPSALAVLRLAMKMYRVGCSTGISAGDAPRKTRSTRRAWVREFSAMSSVELWLPLAEEAGLQSERAKGEVKLAAAGTALLVDDEDIVRASTADMLSDLGYAVVEAASAEEALALIDGGLAPDVLITDHLMPGMIGTDLAQVLKETRPALPVLIISGYAEDEGIASDLPRLTKPFRQGELAASLSKLTTVAGSP